MVSAGYIVFDGCIAENVEFIGSLTGPVENVEII